MRKLSTLGFSSETVRQLRENLPAWESRGLKVVKEVMFSKSPRRTQKKTDRCETGTPIEKQVRVSKVLRKPLCPDCAISLKLCNRNSPRFVLPTGFYFEKKKEKENPNCFKGFFYFACLLCKSEPTLRRKSRVRSQETWALSLALLLTLFMTLDSLLCALLSLLLKWGEEE